MKACFRLALVFVAVAALSACGEQDPAQSVDEASPARVPMAERAQPQVDLAALIRAAAKARHPQFTSAQKQAQSVTEVDEMIQYKAAFEALPSIRDEKDPALHALYADTATLYQLNEVIAAQALLATAGSLSPAGKELQELVDQAYFPVSDPASLEGAENPDAYAAELADYAARANTAFKSLRETRLEGEQLKLAHLRVLAGVYYDTNGAAIAAADAALRLAGDDPRTRRAIEKALADASR